MSTSCRAWHLGPWQSSLAVAHICWIMVFVASSQLLASSSVPLAVWDGIGTRTDVRCFGRIDGQTGNFVGDGGTVGTVIRQGGGRVLVPVS